MAVAGGFLGGVELGAKRFLGHVLHPGVDRGVNAKAIAHRPIPPDRGNHLLADIIDRVVLSARILPVTDHQLFRLRVRQLLGVDEAKIAHAAEDEIARFARSGRDPTRETIC